MRLKCNGESILIILRHAKTPETFPECAGNTFIGVDISKRFKSTCCNYIDVYRRILEGFNNTSVIIINKDAYLCGTF